MQKCSRTKKLLAILKNIPRNIFITLITFYRKWISPIMPPNCRYIPTCSEYAIIALQRYGVFKGLYLAIKRICRCHPRHEGGYDPVP